MSKDTVNLEQSDSEISDGKRDKDGDEGENWQGHSIGFPTDAEEEGEEEKDEKKEDDDEEEVEEVEV